MRAIVERATQLAMQHGISFAAAAGVALGCWLLLARKSHGSRAIGAAFLFAGIGASLLASPAIRSGGWASAGALILGAMAALAVAALLSSLRVTGVAIAYGLIVAIVAIVAVMCGQRLMAGIVMVSAGPVIVALAKGSASRVRESSGVNRTSSPLATALAGAVVFAVILEAGIGRPSLTSAASVDRPIVIASRPATSSAILIGGFALLVAIATGRRARSRTAAAGWS